MPLDEFHSQLVSKALALFPSLTEEDLQPYLLRSRASNAYDAVTLLAESVDMSFRVRGNSYADTEVIQKALENIFLVCGITLHQDIKHLFPIVTVLSRY